MPSLRSQRLSKLALLGALYFVQGMPFGFQSAALPVLLRTRGFSLTAIGFAGALAAPWMLKALWAPLVDRFGSRRFGRRKSWIVPMQLLLAASSLAAAFAVAADAEVAVLVCVLLMNLFAATQDIAVDGLAVDLLGPRELGPGNAGQVVGYKVGMLAGGGLLVWATQWIGWAGLFVGIAVLCLAVCAVVLFALREPPDGAVEVLAATAPPRQRLSLGDVFAALKRALLTPGTPLLLVFIGTYKFGEYLSDAMFKPFLIDAGFSASQLGLWAGTYGLVTSIFGSAAGGLLAARTSIWNALALTSVLRVFPLIGRMVLSLLDSPPSEAVVTIILFEELFGGAITTCVFAFMMASVDRTIGATHYTLLASVEVFGKSPAYWAAGPIAERLGYTPVFVLGAALSIAFLVLLWPLRRVGRVRPATTSRA